jgi:hypothetical protein
MNKVTKIIASKNKLFLIFEDQQEYKNISYINAFNFLFGNKLIDNKTVLSFYNTIISRSELLYIVNKLNEYFLNLNLRVDIENLDYYNNQDFLKDRPKDTYFGFELYGNSKVVFNNIF